jgi:MFS family permease
LRWTLCAVFTDPALLFAVQALHGATVVGLNLGSPLYLDTVAAERLRSTAQGILSMVGMGIAGIASNIAAGWLMDHGGIDAVYLICGWLPVGSCRPKGSEMKNSRKERCRAKHCRNDYGSSRSRRSSRSSRRKEGSLI